MVLDLERDNLLRENDLTIRFITNQQTKTNISKSLDTWLSNLPFQKLKHKLKASVSYKQAYEQGRGVTEISGAAKSNMLELYGEVRQLLRRKEILATLKEF
jgi:cellulose biosynthesis protein BcsQ